MSIDGYNSFNAVILQRARYFEAETGPDMSQRMTIPWQSLSKDALRGVLEDFVTREGTEYGAQEVNLERKVAQVEQQLVKKEVVIVFDAKSDTCSIISASDLPAR
jgi:hypothetical protein|tara:strand:+ start:279 stop:593 length:315 start_codon:yes stop_codon:yes gene_type:complete